MTANVSPRRGTIAATVLTLIIAAGGHTAAQVPSSTKCMGAKLDALGKYEARLLQCESKAAASGDLTGLAACRDRHLGSFLAALSKAGSCAGDQAICLALAEDCRSRVAATFTDTLPSRCEAAKLRAAASLAWRELRCCARATQRSIAVSATCLSNARVRFLLQISAAGFCPDGARRTTSSTARA